jgi:Zn-dependent peptidase ImmA (M78 family)/DNA-binding XRE family transcriptional regulator
MGVFMPRRFAEMRKHSGLSQSELAARLCIDKTIVSRWESGNRQPTLDQQWSISRALGITLDYLLNAEVIVNFEFRALKAGVDKDAVNRARIDAEMQIHYLDSAYRLALQLPQPFAVRMDYLPTQLAVIAKQIRSILKLNQRVVIEELKQALAEVNIQVFEWALPWHISGLSHRNTYAVIFINRLHSRERQLFTLAHEFGHQLFHLGREDKESRQKGIISMIGSNRDPEEKEANAFATELLIPDDALQGMLASFDNTIKHVEVLDSVARFFNVSREAVFYRLVEKGIFNWEEKRSYFSASSAQNPSFNARVEDIERHIPPEFLRIALQMYDEQKISTGKLKEWFFTDRNTLDEYLANRVRQVEEVQLFEEA